MKIAVLLWLLLCAVMAGQSAEARPGGGHSSAGHSSSHHSSAHSSFSYHPSFSSHSGGNASPESAFWMVVIVIIVVLVYIALAQRQPQRQTFVVVPTLANRKNQRLALDQQLAALKQSDPNFSTILFTDFVYSLYNRFYSYATHPEFSYLTPFLSSPLQQHFHNAGPWTITEIVINALRWESVNSLGNDTDSISVVIDANYTLHQHSHATRYTVTERWLFYRHKSVLSPEPQKMQALCCPQCGAPAHFTDAGECGHCGSFINKGDQQWYLGQRVVLQTTALDAQDLVSYSEEQGTQLDTIKQADLAEQMQRWVQRYALPEWDSFWQNFTETIVKAYFLSIYSQWAQGDWPAVRHLLSDRLYESNQFWLSMYAEHGWANRLDNIQISQIVPAKIEQDNFYEAITVRIFASCYDYTEDAKGKLIGGSKRSLRRYSEYWTFVRRIGQEHHSSAYSLSRCPQCGAPADNMGQTGECGYCGSKISTGEYSWVLFLIMQDEGYEG